MLKYESARKQVSETGLRIFKEKLVVGTWGNISVRIEGTEYFAITPSGVEYDQIRPEDIVVMDKSGEIVDGKLKPSIEWPMHNAIYKNRQDIGAIIHVHAIYTTALAMAHMSIPAASEDLVQIVGGDVRVSKYALPGSEELAANAVEALKGRNAVLLANHGSLSAGEDLHETLKIVEIMEKTAQATIYAMSLGKIHVLSNEDVNFMRDFYLNKYGQR